MNIKQNNSVIRKATKDDLAVISSLRYQMFAELGTAHLFVDDFIEKTLTAYSKDYESGICVHFVEEIDGIIVGCAGGRISQDEMFRNPIHGYIMDVYVKRDYRRRGIAKRLTEEIIAWIRSCGVETIKLHAAITVVPLYENLGFENSREMKLVISAKRMIKEGSEGNS